MTELKSLLAALGLAASILLLASFPRTVQAADAEKPAAEAQQPLPKVSIEVNIPATEITVFENCVPLYRKPIAIGQGIHPTPEQESYIRRIEWNPWWYPPPDAEWAKDEKPTPPGPGNPLGLVKMPLSKAILFHGTNKASSIGRPASHGCMRMFNEDATEIAWYLQGLFSEKKDQFFRELYRKNKRTTYVVSLDNPVPVKLIYKPVVARNGSLLFYPDYYHKLSKRRKAAVMEEILRQGIEAQMIDDAKVDELVAHWPKGSTEVPIKDLLTAPLPNKFSWVPECQ
ncbi:MAG: L,D-transpeptidase [Pseudomonadota bacterium]